MKILKLNGGIIMEQLQQALFDLLIIVVCGCVSLIATYAKTTLNKLKLKLETETNAIADKNQKELAQKSINTIDSVILRAVESAEKTIVKEAKACTDDNKLTKEDAERIKKAVKEDVIKTISDDVIASAKTEIEDINTYISKTIESTLLNMAKK